MEDQTKKKFLMKVGIISIMALILIFWILNIKNVFHDNAVAGADQDAAQWQNLRNNFSVTVSEMTKSLDKIKETDAALKTASSSLLEALIKETDKIAASSTIETASSSEVTGNTPVIATSTDKVASSTSEITKNNCPPYINCMPTIGEARPCVVPAGCEGITQIAY
ncbi:MAG: hypothetical protein WC467_00105 [Patescibacteria group bacterium]